MEEKSKTRETQDQVLQNFITETLELIETTRQDRPLLIELHKLAFSIEELDRGVGKAERTQGSFTLRQQAIGHEDGHNVTVSAAEAVLIKRATDYRETVRLGFKDMASRRALGAVGKLPADKQGLITYLRASLTIAMSAPYAEEMARYSYDSATCEAALAEVDALDRALALRASAVNAGVQATARRNADYKDLRTWRADFNRALKRAKARLGR
jgi:hypothetical protein